MKSFFQKKKRKRDYSRGYTIIETMVATSIFLVVVIAGMGALINANFLHAKSEKSRSVMDNMSFIMEDMGRNLRMGYDYHCIDDGNLGATSPKSCQKGTGISFKTPDGDQWVYYIYPDGGIGKSTNGGSSFVLLTPPEVKIKPISGFSVLGAEHLPNEDQPFVQIKLDGEIILKEKTVNFSLQTSISQRVVDL